MKSLKDYLNNFTQKSVSIDDALKELNCSYQDFEQMLKSLSNDEDSDIRRCFYFEKKYFDKNGLENDDSFAHLNKELSAKIVRIVDRYYKTPQKKLNILLTEVTQGEKVTKGSVDNSDIGGLYSSVFTKHGYYGTEIDNFHTMPLEELFSLFPENFCVSKKSTGICVSIPELQIAFSSETFIEAFLLCLEELLKHKNIFIAQVFEKFDDDDSDIYPFAYSPIFYTEEGASKWVKENNPYKDDENCFTKIVQTNRKKA